ncbi:MAG: hypothetical protein KAU21_20865 [Gammaproteobacteria bacterium]|nr:hypothetical protein [Gammaproteobacteria bacterium]
MTNFKTKKQGTNLNLISSALLVVGLLVAGNVSADELKKNVQIEEAQSEQVQNQLINWQEKMTVSLSEKMDSKLQNIIIQAENTRLLKQKTQNMLALAD